MFALILCLTLGWRAGVVELIGELALGVLLFSGPGGGKRIRRCLRVLATAPAPI